MHLFLIRHGETEHNVAGLLAGVTDSRLTNHGVLQTQRLGSDLVRSKKLRFTHVYSSDLQRAYMTANEICKAHNLLNISDPKLEVIKLEILQEQDFGSLELVPWHSRRVEEPEKNESDPAFKPKETKESMRRRANEFIDDQILPLLAIDSEEPMRIAIVSHGIFLGHLWRALLSRLPPKSVSVDTNVDLSAPRQSLEHMAWSNTAYLEVDLHVLTSDDLKAPSTSDNGRAEHESHSPFQDAKLVVKSINDKGHLQNLRRARGGIGSAAHDQRQQHLGSFFKKRKRASSETTGSRKSSKVDNQAGDTTAVKTDEAPDRLDGRRPKVVKEL